MELKKPLHLQSLVSNNKTRVGKQIINQYWLTGGKILLKVFSAQPYKFGKKQKLIAIKNNPNSDSNLMWGGGQSCRAEPLTRGI